MCQFLSKIWTQKRHEHECPCQFRFATCFRVVSSIFLKDANNWRRTKSVSNIQNHKEQVSNNDYSVQISHSYKLKANKSLIKHDPATILHKKANSDQRTVTNAIICKPLLDYETREMPAASKSSDKSLLAASEGWTPSQKTYSEALAQVPADLELHSIDVSTNPVPQHAFLASKNPEINKDWKKVKPIVSAIVTILVLWTGSCMFCLWLQ